MIKPLFTTKLGKVFNTDCYNYMRECEDKKFDLCLCDPPYGIGFDGTSGTTEIKSKKKAPKTYKTHEYMGWDNKTPERKVFYEMQRVSKNQIIFGGNYFTDKLPVSRGWIYWDKKITNSTSPYNSDGELAWTSFDCILRKFTFDWIGFGYLNAKGEERKQHPTQKPVQLFAEILKKYSEKEHTVFDGFAGSGTTGIACEQLGMKYVLCEKEPKYCEIIIKRLKKVTNTLFNL